MSTKWHGLLVLALVTVTASLIVWLVAVHRSSPIGMSANAVIAVGAAFASACIIIGMYETERHPHGGPVLFEFGLVLGIVAPIIGIFVADWLVVGLAFIVYVASIVAPMALSVAAAATEALRQRRRVDPNYNAKAFMRDWQALRRRMALHEHSDRELASHDVAPSESESDGQGFD